MKQILQEELIYEILSVVGEIPKGKAAAYGQIARMIGRDKNARLGRTTGIVKKEGVPMKNAAHVD